MGVYQIVNTVNGKVYVGSALDIERRWGEHIRYLKGKYHHNRHLQRAWNRYGDEAFEFSVLEEVQSESRLLEREQFWIEKLSSYDKRVGYNLTPTAGSNLGFKHSEETKRKMSLAHKGRKLSAEAIQKIAAANRGRKLSEETRARISQANKGKVTKGFEGKKHSYETKLKMSQTRQKGTKRSPKVLKSKAVSDARYKNSPLSEDDVRVIRQRLANGEPCTVIAKDYGVVKSTINNIKLGITWTHVV